MPAKRIKLSESFEPLRPCCFQTDVGFLYMALGSEVTGIAGATLWCPEGEFTRHLSPHGPRLIVARPRQRTPGQRSMTVRPRMGPAAQVRIAIPAVVLGTLPPTMAHSVARFVETNVDILLAYWRGTVGSLDLAQGVVRV
jgi:hypothetical protein